MMYWLSHGLVAAIFLRAGVGKLLGREDFYWQLRALAVVHRRLVPLVSYAVPSSELSAGLLILLPGVESKFAEFLAAAMLAVFTAYALWITITGRKVKCFCFGHDDGAIGQPTVLRNSLLLCAVAFAGLLPANRLSASNILLSLVDGFTTSLLFVGAFQIAAMRKELSGR